MKKRSIAAAAIAASLAFAACGDDDEATTTTAPPTETVATVAPADTTTADTTTADTTGDTMTADTTGDTAMTTGDTAMTEPGDIIEVAGGNPDFSTLVAAVTAAGLVETLQGPGPFTVFAPTNEAFAALPAGLVDKLLLPENKDVLTQILTYHVVAGKVMAADVTAGDVPSVEGSDITITVDGGVQFNGSANVVATDVAASNGVIHVIDAVIVPPDVDVSAL